MKKPLPRTLNLPQLLENKSFFFFGPRATGKTTLIREQLPKAMVINLLRGQEFLRLSSAPWELEALIDGRQGEEKAIVVIDEVQRVPELLNEVHRLIEERDMKFLLTGSSARKLRTQGVNLLAGRAWRADLFPLVSHEIPKFQLDTFLRYGGLPSVVTSNNPEEELHAYVETYLTEEIKAEGSVRQLPAFSRFLKVAALHSGLRINFANVASDSQVPPSTVTEYYTLLEDTLIGFRLEPWTKSVKRKATQTARFYVFDVGVFHTLNETTELSRNSDLYGRSFEHFIAQELRAYLSYRRSRQRLSFWRSQSGAEVDFCVGDTIAIECKASTRTTLRDAKGLQLLREEGVFGIFLVVSNDDIPRLEDGIRFLSWRQFVDELWSDRLVT
jgi:predicted AAA+ superfamily ATPase